MIFEGKDLYRKLGKSSLTYLKISRYIHIFFYVVCKNLLIYIIPLNFVLN